MRRVPLREHFEALRAADAELAAERDRRYTEVTAERQKAIRIKEAADEKALTLASQIQTYKDQQHNGLLQQIDRERARYPTKDDLIAAIEKMQAQIKPLAEYISAAAAIVNGDAQTRTERRLNTGQAVQVIIAVVAVATFIVLYVTKK